ncbi:hypothetical protein BDV93DRAFT_247813 [Ceratobasidium sp. AG-I]|nr:hypothetical protein BDV93DRAFT_247813 [Ceratobasidium sp. AG-I]
MLKSLFLDSCVDEITLSGRWIRGLQGSLSTFWASSSLSFVFTGTTLEILPGISTERKDRWNGGTPMIAIWVGKNENSIASHQPPWKVCDVEAGAGVTLVQTMTVAETYVRIMMIDWSSVFELGSLLVDKGATIMSARTEKIYRIIYIGDSIASGYSPFDPTSAQAPHAPTRGCLDAFPYVAQRFLSQKDPAYKVNVNLVAYPGWTLVAPSEEEKCGGNPTGMLDGFFQVSPWNTDVCAYSESVATAIVIELGTNDQEYYTNERFSLSLREFVCKLLDIMPSPPRYIWIIPPFPNEEDSNSPPRRDFPEVIAALQTELGRGIDIEMCDIVDELTSAVTIDGVHPSLEGNLKLGCRMAQFIEARLWAK